jgi:HK97 gp10 family phage protein
MASNALGMQGLTTLSTQMKTVDKKFRNSVRANLRAAVKQAGEPLVAKIQEAASWSDRIPAATSLSISYRSNGAAVKVQVDHRKAPHAHPLDSGNKGGGTILRHPVFERKLRTRTTWAEMPTRPFFWKTIQANKGNIDQVMEHAVIQVAHDAGFN